MGPEKRDKSGNGNVYAVILVGGKGVRLRPLSTSARPKAFLSITRDRKTMFARTIDRARCIVPAEQIVVVANKAHTGLVLKDLPKIRSKNLILEPISRNTAPAIALTASILARRRPDAIMFILPTDHYILDEKKYLKAVKTGIKFIKNNMDSVIILGVKPDFPSTGYGYVKIKGKKPGDGALKVERFVEKPDLPTAQKYLESGRYLWNTGIFIFSAACILEVTRKLAPKIYNAVTKMRHKGNMYDSLPNISIDYAIMEKVGNMYCVKGDYRWHDMGSFKTLESILKRESRKFVSRGGKIVKII
ncbi:MAG: mannose-1-phosphate guanylyltransferase [Candidatus Omnitrophota bacterium]|nr:mannose-1-phosphate guanylyltransferase [Candidatus Omnitrophota bacterium]